MQGYVLCESELDSALLSSSLGGGITDAMPDQAHEQIASLTRSASFLQRGSKGAKGLQGKGGKAASVLAPVAEAESKGGKGGKAGPGSAKGERGSGEPRRLLSAEEAPQPAAAEEAPSGGKAAKGKGAKGKGK